jgi:hypothetical protein
VVISGVLHAKLPRHTSPLLSDASLLDEVLSLRLGGVSPDSAVDLLGTLWEESLAAREGSLKV